MPAIFYKDAPRKTAVALKLVNWSRFQDVTIRLGGSTLITGVNGSGKSTILDAITYLLTGNTQFNKAARDRDRTVLSYVRGDTKSNGAGRYLRDSGETISYIAMEFVSEADAEHFVVGVCIESRDMATNKSWWFLSRGTKLSEMNMARVENRKLIVTPHNRLSAGERTLKSGDFKGRDEGVSQIQRALGLRCDSATYRSKLLKMLAFDPQNNIDHFIQECVLDPGKTSSLQELRQQRERFEQIRKVYDDMQLGRAKLEEAERRAQDYESKQRLLKSREMMLSYQDVQACAQEKEEIEFQLKAISQKLRELDQQRKAASEELEAARDRWDAVRAKDAFKGMQESIKALEDEIQRLAGEIDKETQQRAALEQLSRQAEELMIWAEGENDEASASSAGIAGLEAEQREALLHLSEAGIDSGVKSEAFLRLAALAETGERQLEADAVHAADERRELEGKRSRLSADIKRLESNLLVFPQEVERAREKISEELAVRGIKTPVRMLAELVSEVTDASWRRAIETFLGRKRFYLIVDGQYCHEALKVVQELQLHDANVVITDQLPDKEIEPGSAASVLEAPNRYARRYINYLLNGLHLCETLEELHEHPQGGLMRDGMLAKSYAASSMDMRRTECCLGADAVKLQLESSKARLDAVQEQLKGVTARLDRLDEGHRLLRAIDLKAEHYDFRSPQSLQEHTVRRASLIKERDRMKSNQDFMAVMEEEKRARELYYRAEQNRTTLDREIGKCTSEREAEQRKQNSNSEALRKAESEYAQQREGQPELESAMLDEYAKLRTRLKRPRVIQSDTVRRIRSDVDAAVRALESAQLEYCKIVEMDVNRRGASFIPFFRKELRDLANVEIEKTQEKLRIQSEKLESAFMNDFVAEINERVHKAREEIDAINRELKTIPFGNDTYRFVMKEKADRSAFFRICRGLEKYMDSPEMYLSSGREDQEMEADIRDFMSVVLAEEDEDEYTDYRKYFSYDMEITSRQGSEEITADLSKKQGSASGGEKQTPYFIILAASLIQCYPRDANCARLAFIDEAFSAMSEERVEQMVKYLETNRFQVIYSAPPNKIKMISPYIATTVSLVMAGRYTSAVEGLITD